MYSRFNYSELYRNCHTILEQDPSNNLGALWLGDFSAALDKKGLKEQNIQTVLTTASGLNVSYGGTIHHRIYQLNDVETANVARYFDDTFNEIDQGLQKGSVLVHCAAGVSRSASCTIAYLMRKFNWSFINAFNFVQRKRKVICPNPGFVRQLRNFETTLKSNTGTSAGPRDTQSNFSSAKKTEESQLSSTFYSSLNKTPTSQLPQIQGGSGGNQQQLQIPFGSSKGFAIEGNNYADMAQSMSANKNSSMKSPGGGPNFPNSSLGVRNVNQLNGAIQDLQNSLDNNSNMYQSNITKLETNGNNGAGVFGSPSGKPSTSTGNQKYMLGQGGGITLYNSNANNTNNSNNNNNMNNNLSIGGNGLQNNKDNGLQENQNAIASQTLFPFSQNQIYGGYYGSNFQNRDMAPSAIQTPNIVTYNANSSLRTQSRGISENNAIQRNAKAVTTASLQNALGINNIYQRQYHQY